MANRVEIGEIVENATGLNVTGALVTVKVHGGANAAVYDAENGGALLTQPLSTVNGKIGADAPSGAWVAEGDYDLVIAGGAPAGGDLTFFWPARRATQFVTTLPAGVGTSLPEDGELAIELYDGTNGGAWFRRYRSAVSAWDMIGGPPPAGGSLPGTPRTRQEFYLTGGTPTIQHMRYNGATWDYVGTPPTVPVTGSPLSILETGQSGHHRAGRILTLADFATLCALPTVPVLLANLTTLTSNLGTGGALVNKGTVTNGNGIDGSATAAQFTGSTAQALYILDTGAADPFRIKSGTYGCWTKTAKRGTRQVCLSKINTSGAAGTSNIWIEINASNVALAVGGAAGAASASGITDVADDRWHHLVASWDGTSTRLYVDGILEAQTSADPGALPGGAVPTNIGGYGADAGTAATLPHFGRVDEAFVTADVLSDDQVRLLYATSFVHGYATTPTRAELSVRRKRRGAALVSGDFPSQPVRLHNLAAGALTDLGSGNVTLTANNAPVTVSGPDGTNLDAYNFILGSSQSLSATDTGLPSGTNSRSYGCWFKTTTFAAATGHIMTWGTTKGTNDSRLVIAGSSGLLTALSAGDTISGPFVGDGLWHHAVVVEENAPTDGIKRKLYLDGRIIGGSTTLNTLTLGGANKLRLGASVTPDEFLTGQISRAFVHSVALTHEQVEVVYQKSSQALVGSIRADAGAHIEAMDATNVYFIGDTIDTNNTVELAVAS